MAFKTWSVGDVLTAADVNTYLGKQSVIVCTSGDRPTSPVEGMTIYETDTDYLLSYNGTSWVAPSDPAWTTFTPTVYQSMTTTPAAISGASITVEYARYQAGPVTIRANVSVQVNVASTTGGVGISLPVAANARYYNIGTMMLMGAATLPSPMSGVAYMSADVSNNLLVLTSESQAYLDVATSGQRLRYSVQYERA